MALRLRVVWLLLFALIAAQTLGLLHRVAHPTHVGAEVFVGAALEESTSPRGWLQDLFTGHDRDSGCVLFDGLNASGVAPELPSLALPVLLPLHVILWSRGEALARWAALFDARGPPTLR